MKTVWKIKPVWTAVILNDILKIAAAKPVGPNCSIKPLSIVLNDNE